MPKAERGRGRKPKRRSGDLAQDDEGDPGQGDAIADAAATPRVPTPRVAKSKSPPWKAALTRWGGVEAPENVEVPMPGIGSQVIVSAIELRPPHRIGRRASFWSHLRDGCHSSARKFVLDFCAKALRFDVSFTRCPVPVLSPD
jgi:hypothetical protein